LHQIILTVRFRGTHAAHKESSMTTYVTRKDMQAEAHGIYDLLPTQFRDRIPSDVEASPQNAMIFRNGFNVMPGLVDDLFKRLQYREGANWPMWKLVAAFYLVEQKIGKSVSMRAGEKIYSTMPWPPHVLTVADALRFTETAYFESHLRAPKERAGCWRVESETATRMVLADDTPYPCSVNEGVVAGICRAFAKNRPSYVVLTPGTAKRVGGLVTRYLVDYAIA
jgi:hypothetical protein